MNKLQEKLLDLMVVVDEYFMKHNVEYSLAAGSLLGSIREGGFISWDDDMDILVKQQEIKKIIKIEWPDFIKVVSYKEGLFNIVKIVDTRFEYKTKGGTTPLYIDVFFLTKMSKNHYDAKRKKILQIGNVVFDRVYYLKTKLKGNIFYRFIKKALIISSIVIPKKVIKKKLLLGYEENGGYWGTPNWDDSANTQNWIFNSEQISNFTRVKFENKVEFSVYSNYEWHLEKHYGKNWKTPIRMEKNIHAIGEIVEINKINLPKNLKILNK